MKRFLSFFLMMGMLIPAAYSAEAVKNNEEPPAVNINNTQSEVSGVDNSQDVGEFLGQLQTAIAAEDHLAVAGMISYPLKIYNDGTVVKEYKDADAVVANYDSLFSDAVKKVITGATASSLFANDQGVMLGNGEIWFDDTNGSFKIRTINPPVVSPEEPAAEPPV